jgi:hypothetical protein
MEVAAAATTAPIRLQKRVRFAASLFGVMQLLSLFAAPSLLGLVWIIFLAAVYKVSAIVNACGGSGARLRLG